LLEHVWNKLDGMDPAKPPVIVPVPLFHSRERERGFNQSRLLAEGLRNRIEKHPGGRKIVVDARLLVRTRATAPQVRLKFQARKENVRGAFAVAKPESVRGRSVLLVDDVMTTGATLSACAAALKKAGAAKVIALTLARATPQFPDNGDTAQSAGVDEFNRHWT
jgi:ComF family protein